MTTTGILRSDQQIAEHIQKQETALQEERQKSAKSYYKLLCEHFNDARESHGLDRDTYRVSFVCGMDRTASDTGIKAFERDILPLGYKVHSTKYKKHRRGVMKGTMQAIVMVHRVTNVPKPTTVERVHALCKLQ